MVVPAFTGFGETLLSVGAATASVRLTVKLLDASVVAAADHHVYPGGLFDQSVRAAERAYPPCAERTSFRRFASCGD